MASTHSWLIREPRVADRVRCKPIHVLCARHLAAVIAAAATAWAGATGLPQKEGAGPAAKPAAASGAVGNKPARTASSSRLQWGDLTAAQQTTLAPLAAEWDQLDTPRKKKWLALSNRYASMKPEEQHRMQQRMQDWVRLTPEQRRLARESYARAKMLKPDQKTEQWQKYQELPEDRKKALAANASVKKPVATLPTAAQRNAPMVQPIKATPKPILEQSVTPQEAARRSVLNPPRSDSGK